MNIYSVFSYVLLSVLLYQMVHFSNNKGIFSCAVLLCYHIKILLLLLLLLLLELITTPCSVRCTFQSYCISMALL